MVDIVDELRGNAFETVCNANENVRGECLKGNCNCVWHLRQKAADEIKRLREALLEIAEGDRPDNKEQFCVGYWGATARAALGEGKE
jgi:hypothetical protein